MKITTWLKLDLVSLLAGIVSRIAAAVEAKRKARADAKAAAKKGNLQERIAAIEAFLGIA